MSSYSVWAVGRLLLDPRQPVMPTVAIQILPGSHPHQFPKGKKATDLFLSNMQPMPASKSHQFLCSYRIVLCWFCFKSLKLYSFYNFIINYFDYIDEKWYLSIQTHTYIYAFTRLVLHDFDESFNSHLSQGPLPRHLVTVNLDALEASLHEPGWVKCKARPHLRFAWGVFFTLFLHASHFFSKPRIPLQDHCIL